MVPPFHRGSNETARRRARDKKHMLMGILAAICVVIGIAIYRGAGAQGRAALIYPDGQVKFDWPWVESCARQGEPMCIVAMAARKEGCR